MDADSPSEARLLASSCLMCHTPLLYAYEPREDLLPPMPLCPVCGAVIADRHRLDAARAIDDSARQVRQAATTLKGQLVAGQLRTIARQLSGASRRLRGGR